MISQILKYIGTGLISSGVSIYVFKLLLIKRKVIISSNDVSTQTNTSQLVDKLTLTDESKLVDKLIQTNHTGSINNNSPNLTLSPTSTKDSTTSNYGISSNNGELIPLNNNSELISSSNNNQLISSNNNDQLISSNNDGQLVSTNFELPTLPASTQDYADKLQSYLNSISFSYDLNGLLSYKELGAAMLINNITTILFLGIPLVTGTLQGHLLSQGIVFGSNFLMKYTKNTDTLYRASRYSNIDPIIYDPAINIYGSQLTLLIDLLARNHPCFIHLINLGYIDDTTILLGTLSMNHGIKYLGNLNCNPSTLMDDIIKCFNNDPIKLVADQQSNINGKLNLHTNSMRIHFHSTNILNFVFGYTTHMFGRITLPFGVFFNYKWASSISNLINNTSVIESSNSSSNLLESSDSSSRLIEFNTEPDILESINSSSRLIGSINSSSRLLRYNSLLSRVNESNSISDESITNIISARIDSQD